MMRNPLTLDTLWAKTTWVLICVGVSLLGVSFLQGWGNLCKDEAYQTWSILNWESSRLAPLTYWIGYKWMEIFGFKVVNLRLLATIVGSLAVTTSVIYSYYRTRNLILSGILLMLGAWVWRADAFMLYNWDSGSYLYDCIGLICIVEYFRQPSVRKAVICGMACALMALGRLPSGIVVPSMCVLMYCYGRENGGTGRDNVYHISAFVIAFSIMFIGMLILMYGNLWEYVNTIGEGKVSGHSLSDLGHYKWRMTMLLKWFSFLYFPAFLCVLLPLVFTKRLFMDRGVERKRHMWSIALMCLSVVAVALWTAKLFVGTSTECAQGYSAPVVMAFLLLPAVRNFANPEKRKMKMPTWQLWGCGVIVVSMIFGSDAYTERIEAGFMLPIIITILWSAKNRNVNNYLWVVIVLWLISSIGINAVHWNMQLTECKYSYGSEMGIYSGVKSSEDFEKTINDLIPAVHEIKKTGERYILIDNRNIIGLVIGEDDGPNYHDFGFFSTCPTNWGPEHFKMLDTINAVVYRKDCYIDRIEVQQVVKMLEERGYINQEDIGDAIIIRKAD